MYYESNNYLAHHGIKGQKWGIRRFQNDDGSLTAEGQERYGNKKEHSDKGIVRKTIGSEFGEKAYANWRERRHKKNLEKAKNGEYKNEEKRQKKIDKYQSKLDAQSAANRNLEAYRSHKSAAELVTQNALMGIFAPNFRHARARGAGVVRSVLEAAPTPLGVALRMAGDKKAYGKYIVYGDMDDADSSIYHANK